jgi:putative PIN family toxin of toxin-antitoxin system
MNRQKPTVVLDTGVVLQATISDKGPAAKILDMVDDEELELFVSHELLAEMRAVLLRPVIRIKNARYTDDDIEHLLERLKTKGTLIAHLPAHFPYERGSDDEHVINLAVQAGAEFLVSRDRDLLDLMSNAEFLSRYPHLIVLDPPTFLKRILTTSDESK